MDLIKETAVCEKVIDAMLPVLENEIENFDSGYMVSEIITVRCFYGKTVTADMWALLHKILRGLITVISDSSDVEMA